MTTIREKLADVRARRERLALRAGLLTYGTLFLLAAVSVGLTESVFAFDSIGRTVLVLLGVLFLVFTLVRLVAIPLLRSLGVLRCSDDFMLARLVGESFPRVKDRLLNLLQLENERASGYSPYSPELVDASFQDLADIVHDLDFASSVDTSPAIRAAKHFTLTAIGSLLLLLAAPQALSGAFYRLVHFRTEFTPLPAYSFEISPGNADIVKGEAVDITVRVRPSADAGASNAVRVELLLRQEGQSAIERIDPETDADGIYRARLPSVRSTTEYFARANRAESEHYRLTVIDRPVIRALQLRLEYPPYTKLPPRVQEEYAGDISALPGTKVALNGTASKELEGGYLLFGSAERIPLRTQGTRFSAEFPVTTQTAYQVELRDSGGLTNLNPVRYQITVVPDEVPAVAILQPGRNIDIAGDRYLPLLIRARDDFGLSSLRLAYRLVHSRYELPRERHTFAEIPLPPLAREDVQIHFTWDLSPLKLAPEDVVEYYAEAFDNDAVRGPKSARSSIYLLRLPSLEEVFAEADRGHEQALDELKQSLEQARDLKERLESINQDLKKNREMDWQQQKKLEEMAKKYQELQKKLDDVQKRVDDVVQKMDQQNVLSHETLEKYLELQHLFEQLNSAELQQYLKQMQQAMQSINREQLQQALQKMTFSEERLRQSIERTIELLKRIQIEQKMDEVRRRAEELEAAQKELAERTASERPGSEKLDDLSKRQNDLAARQEEFERAAADLQKRMEDFFAEMPVDRMEQLNQELARRQLDERMRDAGRQIQQGNLLQAEQTQHQIQQQLQSVSAELQSMQSQLLQQQAQHVLNELRRATSNLLELSKREEALKLQSQNAPPLSPQLRQNAQDQMRVMQDMRNVIEGLSELAKRSFAVTPEMGRAIGEAFAHMQGAMNALDSRNGFHASQEQGSAMAALNRAAMHIQQAMQTMMQGGMGSGMGGLLQQLQMMASQQQSINLQTQQAADAARLAVEQEALRKSVEQLNREAQASGEQRRILGDLERIAEEMREVVRDLEQNDVNPETIQRQERILSRLLDASKSLRERDFEKRRRSETGRQIARTSPGELDPTVLEGRNRLQEDLLKALEQGYSKDYLELIRKYFQALQKVDLRE